MLGVGSYTFVNKKGNAALFLPKYSWRKQDYTAANSWSLLMLLKEQLLWKSLVTCFVSAFFPSGILKRPQPALEHSFLLLWSSATAPKSHAYMRLFPFAWKQCFYLVLWWLPAGSLVALPAGDGKAIGAVRWHRRPGVAGFRLDPAAAWLPRRRQPSGARDHRLASYPFGLCQLKHAVS